MNTVEITIVNKLNSRKILYSTVYNLKVEIENKVLYSQVQKLYNRYKIENDNIK